MDSLLDPMMGLFLLSHPNITLEKENKIYSVNEGNFNNWDEKPKTRFLIIKKINSKQDMLAQWSLMYTELFLKVVCFYTQVTRKTLMEN